MQNPIEIYLVTEAMQNSNTLRRIGKIYMVRDAPPFKCRAVAIPALWMEEKDAYTVLVAPDLPPIEGRLRSLEELWTKGT